jgi:putative oxidoreductase
MNAQAFPLVVARILLALMFVASGISKFTGLGGTADYIGSVGLPAPQLLAFGAAALEVVAGVLLIIGWQARWAALALAVFTLLASVLFHNFWAMPADKAFMQQLMFMKNMSVIGGLLFVFAFGAGSVSLDARRTAA